MSAADGPRGSLTVQWCDEVPEWLHSVAHAMEEAAFHCKPPPAFCSSNETVVLKVNMQRASAEEKIRISGRSAFIAKSVTRNFSSEEVEVKDLVFVARRSPLIVPPIMVLETRLGTWLRKRGLLRWLIMVLGLGAISLGMVAGSLGTVYYRVPDPADSTTLVDLRLRSLTVTLLELAYSIVFAFVIMHAMCWGLLREVLSSFDCLLILCCRFAANLVELYETCHLANSANLLDGWVVVAELIYALLIILPGNAVLGCIDAIVVPRKAKLLVLVFCAAYYWWLYGRSAYLRTWSSTEICLGSNCTHVKELYDGLTWNCGLFVTKFAFSFIKGRDFAVLRTSYEPPKYLQEENAALDTSSFARMVSDLSGQGSLVHNFSSRSQVPASGPSGPSAGQSYRAADQAADGIVSGCTAEYAIRSTGEISYPGQAVGSQSSFEVGGLDIENLLKSGKIPDIVCETRSLSSESTGHPDSRLASKASGHLLGRLVSESTDEHSRLTSKMTEFSLEHVRWADNVDATDPERGIHRNLTTELQR
eukprot:TRINITY_DN8529_c0_g1_i1.p1 TRINITY_DN8529_c0_g1~~TRINITY_DN8529_c0_g1_i1.p1  ORF type:complete len:533 (+),score=30.26 TRINITY_DN8529_c0_g1_i1:91-1689(+)